MSSVVFNRRLWCLSLSLIGLLGIAVLVAWSSSARASCRDGCDVLSHTHAHGGSGNVYGYCDVPAAAFRPIYSRTAYDGEPDNWFDGRTWFRQGDVLVCCDGQINKWHESAWSQWGQYTDGPFSGYYHQYCNYCMTGR